MKFRETTNTRRSAVACEPCSLRPESRAPIWLTNIVSDECKPGFACLPMRVTLRGNPLELGGITRSIVHDELSARL